ncbi:MAG: hypothetical protein HC881_07380 [Leptolyngbyaceae cyanobacterium SL_7_1]|nr:hypothetical protein [Leptolyngbyaceae cyanobacterium SL_7_1]
MHNSHTRLLVVQALAQLSDAQVIPALLMVVNDRSAEVRAIALEALSHFYHPVITRHLVQGLHDPSSLVRKSAIVGVSLQASLLETDPVALLAFLLADLNPTVGRQAALALGRLQTDAAAQALTQALIAPTSPIELQLDCVRSLGWMQSAAALDGLADGLGSVSEQVKLEIVAVLGRVAPPPLKATATAILVAALQAQAWQQPIILKRAIAFSLGQLGDPQAIDPLIYLLADEDASVCLHAIAALKHLETEPVLQRFHHFRQLTSSPMALQQGIAIAQQEWGDRETT